MAAALVDHEAEILLEQQVPTPVSDDAEVVFDALAAVIDDVVAGRPAGPTCAVWDAAGP